MCASTNSVQNCFYKMRNESKTYKGGSGAEIGSTMHLHWVGTLTRSGLAQF